MKSNLQTDRVTIFTKQGCQVCNYTKDFLEKADVKFQNIVVDNLEDEFKALDALIQHTGQKTVPFIYIGE